MTCVMEFWVEGPHDQKVLPRLAIRTLAELGKTSPENLERKVDVRCYSIKDVLRSSVALPGPGKMEPFARKLLAAFDRRSPGALAVAIWDEDGRPDRLRSRDQVNNYLARHGQLGAVAGICVRMLEAWLLVDPAAFKSCFGRGPDAGLPGNPEDSEEPKSLLSEILSRLQIEVCGDSYAALADAVLLPELAKKCAKSYGTFRGDLARFVMPRLATLLD